MNKDQVPGTEISGEELDELISLFLDGEIGEADIRRLEEVLSQGEEALRRYRELADLHAQLAWQRRWQPPLEAVVEPIALPPPPDDDATGSWTWWGGGWPVTLPVILLSVTVLAAVVLGVVYLSGTRGGQPHGAETADHQGTKMQVNTPTEPEKAVADQPAVLSNTDGDVAQLSRAVSPHWRGRQNPEVGSTLTPGWLRLSEGLVQLDFFSGATLLLRGPAEVELRSAGEIYLKSGAASCYVSELGRGFRIVTAGMDVIDLGTAFSLDVQEGRQPEIHVSKGKVAIKTDRVPAAVELSADRTVGLQDGKLIAIAYEPKKFPRIEEMARQIAAEKNEGYQRWRTTAERLDNDRSTLLHYTFGAGGADGLAIKNVAANSGRGTDGVMIGCRPTAGRWPQKQALEYRNVGDRVLFQVPGKFEHLTFVVWARIDALTQDLTAILMTEPPFRREHFVLLADEVRAQAGARRAASPAQDLRWELNRNRILWFNVGYYVPPEGYKWAENRWEGAIGGTENWGKWVCLAVTCDARSGRLKQYVNGQMVGGRQLPRHDPLLLDYMTLGNYGTWGEEAKLAEKERRFYGAFDELLIAERVYSDDEIYQLYEAGRP